MGILALALVIIVAGVLVIRGLADRGQALTDPNPPAPTVSGWNDSSPLPTATPPPSPSPSPKHSPSPKKSATPKKSPSPQGQVACATGNPGQRAPHPNDGRVHGGDLSFTPVFPEDTGYAQQMTWAWDVDGTEEETEPGWAAMMADGALHADDGFRTSEQSAEGMMQCIASSAYYDGFTGRKNVFSKAVTVDGHQGWALRVQIFVDKPAGLSVPGDTAEVIVVDTGKPGQLSFFAGFVPIGDQHRTQLLDQTIAGLQVD
ncbi:hypothetical protein GCM10027613_34550 [Microlunatus endophyticus]